MKEREEGKMEGAGLLILSSNVNQTVSVVVCSVLLSCGAGWAGSRWGRGWHAAVSRECFITESGRTLTQCYIIAVSL